MNPTQPKNSNFISCHLSTAFRLIVWPMAWVAWAAGIRAATPADYTGPNGTWSVGGNWSTNPVVPLNAGANAYEVTITGKTVTFNVAGSSAVESLGLTTATLTLTAGNNLSVVNGLTAGASTINAQQAVFAVGGPVSMSGTSLFTSNGGSMTLPGLTTYGTTSGAGGTFQADGASSKLLLSGLTTVGLAGRGLTARAQNGGELALGALTGLSGTGSIFEGVTFQATGSSSIFRANALASLTMNGAAITVQATNGGYSEMNSLGMVGNGGSIFGNFNAYADGANSLLSLPALTAINLNVATNTLRATAGGHLEVPVLSHVSAAFAGSSEKLVIESKGAGSQVNLGSGLTTLTEFAVTVQGGGTVLWGSPTTMITGSITIDGSGSLNTAALTNLDSTNLTATNGATLSLPATGFVTDKRASTWQATAAGSILQLGSLTSINLTNNDLTLSAKSGGSVQLPTLTTVANTARTLHLETVGSGSQVNVPGLGADLSRLDVSVTGGTVLWGSPQTLQRSSVKLDTGGTLNLATLTNIDSTSLNAVNGATITVPLVTGYSTVPGTGATVQAGVGSTVSLPAVTSITNPGDIYNGLTFKASGAGATVALGALHTVTMSGASITFQAQSGGTLQANTLATVSNLGSIFGNFNAYADGANSKVLMTGLNTMQLNGASNNLRATDGGELELPGLATVATTGNIFEAFNVQSSGPGSVVNLAGLTNTVPFKDSLNLSNGGELDLGGLNSPFKLSFAANFANGSTGALDVYLNHTLLQSILPDDNGTFDSYVLAINSFQPGGSVIGFIANGSGASVTLQDYSVTIPEPGTAGWFGIGLCGLNLLRRRKQG
ncbi:MAG: hypothetical protein NTW21_24735 [Verrucomicrobia bacterium]|nr:hypothetical protein [Verrucomicrobiota bacterium]